MSLTFSPCQIFEHRRGSLPLLVIRTHQQIVWEIFIRFRSDSLRLLHSSAMIESPNLCPTPFSFDLTRPAEMNVYQNPMQKVKEIPTCKRATFRVSRARS